jgi:hypothetical protein
MKKSITIILTLLLIVAVFSCKKEKTDDNDNQDNNPPTTDNYSSIDNFFAVNASPIQTYSIDCSAGGSFTTTNGTIVSIPTNAFVMQNGAPTVGTVTISFKDIYKKSDMVLNNMPTNQIWNERPLKSAGMFYIEARQGTQLLEIAPGKKLTITQPLNGLPIDTDMQPFIFQILGDTVNGWVAPPNDSLGNPIDSVFWTANNYVFSMFQFSHNGDTGTWGNTDNPNYFSAYPNTTLILHALDNPDDYATYMFLIFHDINSMVHVYRYMSDFPDPYAPVGLECTAVAIGVKGGKLYSSFTPITITNNLTVNFSLTETTTDAFIAQLNTLN